MLSKIRLQTGFTLAFSAVMLAIILAIYWVIDFFVLDAYEQVMISNTKQLALELSEQVDLYLNDLNQLTRNSVGNQNLKEDMRLLDQLNQELTQYETLFFDRNFESYSSYLLNYSELSPSNVYIYGRQNRFKFAYGALPLHSNFETVYERSPEKLRPGRAVFYFHNANTADEVDRPSVSIIRAFSEITGYVLGYIEIQQDYTMLNKLANLGQNGTVYILDQQGQIIYPAEKVDDDTHQLLHEVIHHKNEGFRTDQYFYTAHISADSGLATIVKRPNEQVFEPFYRLRNITLVTILAVSVFSVFTVYFVTKQLTAPIRLLRNRVKKMDFENFSLFPNPKSMNNEINLLNEAFQQMVQRLRRSMERELVANQEKMKARFSALQAQIAPHFIHNILYLISISAEEGRKEDVINMCKRLSDMLRYITAFPYHNVTLAEEMEYTINYLTLIQYKYEDFIQPSIEVEEEANTVVLPRLTIQPFVENAIKHAFNNIDPPWKIRIVCRVRESEWEVVIEDNGSGIDADKWAHLQRQIDELITEESFTLEKSEECGGLGIINTVMRLKLLYPQTLRFALENKTDGGVRVVMGASLKRDTNAKGGQQDVLRDGYRGQQADRP